MPSHSTGHRRAGLLELVRDLIDFAYRGWIEEWSRAARLGSPRNETFLSATWLTATTEGELRLQRPAPDDARLDEQRRGVSLECSTDSKVRRVNALQ